MMKAEGCSHWRSIKVWRQCRRKQVKDADGVNFLVRVGGGNIAFPTLIQLKFFHWVTLILNRREG